MEKGVSADFPEFRPRPRTWGFCCGFLASRSRCPYYQLTTAATATAPAAGTAAAIVFAVVSATSTLLIQ